MTLYIIYDVFKGKPKFIEEVMEWIDSVAQSSKGAALRRRKANEPTITISTPLKINQGKKQMLFFTFPHRTAGTVLSNIPRMRAAFTNLKDANAYLLGTVNDEEYGGFRILKRKLYK